MLITVDLWNTLIRITPANAHFLTRYLVTCSSYDEAKINRLIHIVGRFFDDLAIVTGSEISSLLKLERLIDVCHAKVDVGELENAIHLDLKTNPPVFIDSSTLISFDSFLTSKGHRWVVASNSGFVSSEIMTNVLTALRFDRFSAFAGAFFSESLCCAKPDKGFFMQIEQATSDIIRFHIGDHPVADATASLASGHAIHFCSTKINSSFSGVSGERASHVCANWQEVLQLVKAELQ